MKSVQVVRCQVSGVRYLKVIFSLLFFFLTTDYCLPTIVFADEIDNFSAEQKALEAHVKASSDMIYQQEEWKALYYQNIQIISLLKEIRDLVQTQGEKTAKADQKT